jgi:hypothetical protein
MSCECAITAERLAIVWRLLAGAPPGGNGQSSRAAVETDRRTLVELGLGRKPQAKSSGWDENLMFLEGEAVGNGRWVLTHVPAGPRLASSPRPAPFFGGRVTA